MRVLEKHVRMRTFVTEYYLQDAGGQSPYTWCKSNCGGFDNYWLLMTIKPFNNLGWRFAPQSHTSWTSLCLLAHMLEGVMNMWTSAVEDLSLETGGKKRGWSHLIHSQTSDTGLEASALQSKSESCLLWNIPVLWTLQKMSTSLKQNWVKRSKCKLKSAQGERDDCN